MATWHFYAAADLTEDDTFDLLVWRPQADPTKYMLVARQSVTVKAGEGHGLKDFPADVATQAAELQAGDVLGYYIPGGAKSVIAQDVDINIAEEPWFISRPAPEPGEIWTYDLLGGKREMSLYADVEPTVGP